MRQFLRKKGEKGITLIALVITIIILLILAAITISALTGDNGILARAADTKLQTEIAKEKEELAVAYNGAKIEKRGKEIVAEDMNTQFSKNGTNANARGNSIITVKFTESGRIYEIDENGKITESTTEWKEYEITATMTKLHQYYVDGDMANGYQLKNDGSDCISIESREELKYLSEYTNLNNQTENITFVILNDINLNEGIAFGGDGSITGGTPEEWIPIGEMERIEVASQSDWDSKIAQYGKLYSSTEREKSYSNWTDEYYYIKTSFKGKIDGQGHIIKGLYSEGEEIGLIGVLENGTIENLTMSNNYLLAGECSGILVGKIIGDKVEIRNIDSKNNYIDINNDYVGGICGAVLEGNATFESVYSENIAKLKSGGGNFGIGGIIGSARGDNISIYNSSNNTELMGKTSESIYIEAVAGIIGDSGVENLEINDCYNNANIEGYYYAGGIIGESINSNTIVKNTYNTGAVGGSYYTGGIIGFEASDYVEIADSYNKGKIYNTERNGLSYGGIIGQCRANLNMYNCYNMGEIYASEEFYTSGDVGGLIGQNNQGNIYNCYNIGKINLYIYGDSHLYSEAGIGTLFGNMGSEWGGTNIANCFSTCEVVLNYPSNQNVERTVYFGNIGVAFSNVNIENCYAYTNKTINLPENACKFGQNIGIADAENQEDNGIKILTGYIDKNNENPSIAYKSEYATQNIQEIDAYQSQEFCNVLNSWVNSNNEEEKYSEWKYDANKNEGCPYLEFNEI